MEEFKLGSTDKLKIENTVQDALNSMGASVGMPVRVFDIAASKDVNIYSVVFDEIENKDVLACSFVDEDAEDERVIFIGRNMDSTPKRKRFLAAHELGHHLLHENLCRDGFVFYKYKDRGEDSDGALAAADDGNEELHDDMDVELQADYFARTILMPEPLFKEKASLCGCDVETLSDTFGAPKFAVVARLEEFGLGD